MERKLAAILAADVVGYSALMERDEAGTFERLKVRRRELFEPEIEKRRGRIFKLMGDGLLAEFGSVVDAVECAVSLQRGLAERNTIVPENEHITVRIGVNLGEVIVEGDDRYGEGVNVAARLEQLAEPGGICVSGKVALEVDKKLAFEFEPMGDQQVKNIAKPVPAYRVVLGGSALAVPMAEPLVLPNKPSIAVLPFTNMSGDPEQEYFADGLVEDLITSLSKFSGLFVIARNSTFAYKSKTVDIRQIAKELGVRYVLEGSVRRAANRLRITGQLVEGSTATHVWADKFEGTVEDVFDLQDRLTESIVGAIEPSVRWAEVERARRKRPERLDAYDLYLRALPHTYANKPTDTDDALRLLDQALLLDPNLAIAHAHAAWCHEQRYFRGRFHRQDRTAALEHADIALSIGTDDPQALSIAAFARARITHDYEGAISAFDRGLEMNGNSALTLGFSALLCASAERYGQAIEHARKALRLSPFDPFNYHPYCALAHAYFFTGHFDQVVTNSNLAIHTNPGFRVPHAFLVAGQVSLGHLDAAHMAAGRLLEIAPSWTIGSFVEMEFVRPQLMDAFAEALRKAGLPE
jgi:TolB-like protein/class 3 adenylate cyclase/Flp pilus assembly protein TadD